MPNTFQGQQLPKFPSVWYHPVYGAREIASYDDYLELDQDWRQTAAEADKDRTETEARVVMNHNEQVKRAMVLQAAEERGKTQQGRPGHTEFAFSRKPDVEGADAIARNSVQAQESLDKGNAEPL
jgi:hypothetical protein